MERQSIFRREFGNRDANKRLMYAAIAGVLLFGGHGCDLRSANHSRVGQDSGTGYNPRNDPEIQMWGKILKDVEVRYSTDRDSETKPVYMFPEN